jgi:Fe-S cluster biogenesis protein NfuA
MTKVTPRKIKPKKIASASPVPAELTAAIVRLRRALATHGGDIQLVSFVRGTVKVRLTGACHGCPMAAMTLRDTVEKYLVAKVPGVRKVVAVE